MKAVYQEAAGLAKKAERFVLATVVNTKGSTPQKPGATLLVRQDGSTVGTLGGGCVEGDIWFAAKEALREGTGPLYKDYYLNEEIAARDGLVCGGSMYFYIDPILEPAAFNPLATSITSAYDGHESLAIATLVNSTSRPIGARIVIREDGTFEGTLSEPALDARAIEAGLAAMPMGKAERFLTEAGDEVFVAGYTAPPTLLLVGGGHVNLATAKIAHTLGFRIMVADDRREFANEDRFPMAEQINVGPYDRALEPFPITPNTAIVVAARGHRFDDLALEAAARTPAGYVGLIGSKRKAIMIFESMLKNGVPVERIKQIHSPVGLDLGGRDPAEIAVSIVAELVAWRNGHSGGSLKLGSAQVDRLAAKVLPAPAAG